jgi:hypothetical protein
VSNLDELNFQEQFGRRKRIVLFSAPETALRIFTATSVSTLWSVAETLPPPSANNGPCSIASIASSIRISAETPVASATFSGE